MGKTSNGSGTKNSTGENGRARGSRQAAEEDWRQSAAAGKQPIMNTSEKLKSLRALGLSNFTENDLIGCLQHCAYNLDRAAEMLVTGMYVTKKKANTSANHAPTASTRQDKDRKAAAATTTAVTTPPSSNRAKPAYPEGPQSYVALDVVVPLGPATARKTVKDEPVPTVTPKTPLTHHRHSSLMAKAATRGPSSEAVSLSNAVNDEISHPVIDIFDDSDSDFVETPWTCTGEWLLCHRVLPAAVCTTRNGCMKYQENFELSPSFSKKAQPMLYFRGERIEGRLPERLAALLVPLLMGGSKQKTILSTKRVKNDSDAEQAPILRLECHAYMDDADIPIGGHVPVSLSVWLVEPEKFFQLFDDEEANAQVNLFQDRKKAGRPKRTESSQALGRLGSAAFELLQWAEYGDLPKFTPPPTTNEEVTKSTNNQKCLGNSKQEVGEDEGLMELNEQDFEDDPAIPASNELTKSITTTDEWAAKLPEAQDPPGFENGLHLRPYQRQALHWMRSREVDGTTRKQMEEELNLLTDLASQQQEQRNQPAPDHHQTISSSDFVIHCDCGPVLLSNKAKRQTRTIDGEINPLSHPLWKTRFLASPNKSRSLCFYVNELMGIATHKTPKPPTPCSGGILADEMGLGKTVMLLGLILQQKADGCAKEQVGEERAPSTTLVVAKLSLLPQWEDEIRTKTNLSYFLYYGTSKASMEDLENVDVVITTYGTMQGEVKRKNPLLSSIRWLRVILDEAHCVRNQQTLASKVCCSLNAKHRWCVSGTIIQNSVADIFGIMKFLHHEPWCIPAFWQRAITKPLSEGSSGSDSSDGEQRSDAFGLVLGRLRRVLAPLMLRRTKDSLAKDGKPILSLPPVETKIVSVDLSSPEREFYNALLARSVELFDGFVDRGDAAKSYFKILCLISRLRQACDHISLTVRTRLEDDDTMTLEDGSAAQSSNKAPQTPHQEDNDGVLLGATFLKDLYDKIFVTPAQSKKRDSEDPDDRDKTSKRARQLSYVSSVANNLSVAVSKNHSHVEEECPICLENPRIEDAVLTPCAHIYCKSCLVGVLLENADDKQKSIKASLSFHCPDGTCPICSCKIEAKKIIALTKLDNGEFTTYYLTSSKPVAAAAAVKPEPVVKRGLRDTQEGNAGSSARLVLESYMQGNDSSKMIAVLKELYAVWELDPGSKVIVFSQFLGFLDLLEVRLQKEGIDFSRLDGKLSLSKRMKVLEAFRTSHPAAIANSAPGTKKGTVLLMSMAAGAEGLHLVAASSVFIVDPWWNVAREDQCINRIHRIGQNAAQVRVRKFVVRESVEERIIELQRRKKHVADEVYNDVGRHEDTGSLRLSMADFKLIFH
ncbi:hypothetical protein ACA910_021136 [Epithemia clementina (nom. ined.)]